MCVDFRLSHAAFLLCNADSLLALANGAAGGPVIEDGDSIEARRLEAALTALMQGAWRGSVTV